jgi:hypothetical protein
VREISPNRLDFERRQRAVAGVVRLEGRQGKVAIAFEIDLGRTRTGGLDCRLIPHYSASRSVESAGIAGLDPAILYFAKKMDARVEPAHDGEVAVQFDPS